MEVDTRQADASSASRRRGFPIRSLPRWSEGGAEERFPLQSNLLPESWLNALNHSYSVRSSQRWWWLRSSRSMLVMPEAKASAHCLACEVGGSSDCCEGGADCSRSWLVWGSCQRRKLVRDAFVRVRLLLTALAVAGSVLTANYHISCFLLPSGPVT